MEGAPEAPFEFLAEPPEFTAFPTTSDSVPENDFRTTLRKMVSSVAVITARSSDIRNGLTGTSICSVTASPPTMLICVNKAAAADPLIAASGAFAINYLADGQHQIGRLFTGTKYEGETRFSEGNWLCLETGSPVLEGAVASFDCRVQSRIILATHNIYHGRVVAVTSLDDGPLLYRDGSFRRLQSNR